MAEVALAILHDRESDMVLVIKRAKASDFTGWAFPGGKIERLRNESGRFETAEEAARRELLEETGVEVSFHGQVIYQRTHPITNVKLQYVYFGLQGKRKAQPLEKDKADDCVWVPMNKLDSLFACSVANELVAGVKRAKHRKYSAFA